MVEIEIGVLRCQCLDRRIDSQQRLVSEIAAWERQRNTSRARIRYRPGMWLEFRSVISGNVKVSYC